MESDENKRLFFLTHKVKPYFNCPWTGTQCADRLLCVQKDECWRFANDKRSSLGELEGGSWDLTQRQQS